MASWWVQALVIGPVVAVLVGFVAVTRWKRSRRRPSPGDADTFEFRRYRGCRRRRARTGGRR